MLHRWRQWRAKRFIARHPFPQQAWQEVRSNLPLIEALDDEAAKRLGLRAWYLLHRKRLSIPEGHDVDLPTRLGLFAQASLLTLGWSDADAEDAFANVHEVLLLPDVFRRRASAMDDAGVIHEYPDERIGETWYQGPVVLSLVDVMESGDWSGFNVIIHEFAHKLDMGNSQEAEGFPPLPADMSASVWHRVFSAVWDDLQEHLARGKNPPIDDYAASDPGECFAVCCEYFFTAPQVLVRAYPELYSLLEHYFQQSPLKRLTPTGQPDHSGDVDQTRERSGGFESGHF
ncbi:zinc-dependent peptidase [Halomonas sp. M20]|uniref:M90 family metallopeptidase n=1 Tax=Halomonas sp. M20 TaxID=2763264 RepID=UPI001D0B1341|nr:M90 family metallopeptidase [Halomonas sp. M20]